MRAAPAVDRRGPALLILVAMLAGAGGCTSPSGGDEPSPTASTPVLESPSPAPPAASDAGSAAAPSLAAPPDAILAVDGGAGVTGALGSYTWGDTGSDAPWLPGAPASAPVGATLVATVDGVPVESWSARYGSSSGPDPGDVTVLGSGDGPMSFDGPPAGSWTVALDVTFGDDLGGASYYWRLDVE